MATVTIKGALTKEVIENGTYRETGATALADDGITDVSGAIVITDDIVIGTAGAYTVTYTLPQNLSGDEFEVAVETVETRAVNVIAAVGNVDTTFDLGDENRRGDSTSGTAYDALVDAANAGTPPAGNSSAYFSELALDPYEVKHSK